ncbi:MAG: acyltransferase [Gammaproteobacteria bacterium]|nr:acyltransferase [Gammaproteobacteria bacterium]
MRDKLKKVLYWICIVSISPIMLSYILLIQLVSNKDSIFEAFSQFFSLIPGIPGNYLRSAYYFLTLDNASQDIVVSFSTLLFQRETEIHSGVYIGPQCNIGKCHIGENTLLGSAVHVMSGKNQHYFDDLDTPIRNQGGSFEKIKIGQNCWIGNGSLIMANVGNHCIIGAGSVVIHDIPDYSIVAGNPAKVIRTRVINNG